MKRTFLPLLLFLAFPVLTHAGELSVYYLNNLAVQYEGTGFRQTQAGWEVKVKPQAGGQGLRWRQGAFQLQYWRNNPHFSTEGGNGGLQLGRTLLAADVALADVRLPLAGSVVEAVAGLSGARFRLDRKDVSFNGVNDPAGARETLTAAGPVLGFHGRAGEPRPGAWTFWADGEILIGHYLWTRNRLRVDGGNLSRSGFSYLFRAEAGLRRGPWRVGLGLLRQMHEVVVPGGRTLPNGGAVSLPVNKVDFGSPFVSVTYEF